MWEELDAIDWAANCCQFQQCSSTIRAFHRHARRKLRRLSRTVSRRMGPDRRTGAQPSKRWLRANDRRNKVHHRIADLRRDGIHKLTTGLAREYGTIVVEDLNVAGMHAKRTWSRP
ncbi:transposase [Kitasatospora sp. NPDC058190]|uniref:transposase n=1 Tax=Kitasatospora sp. NPDC058190 TaxID=3346371 RepID=UPI0036D769C2